MEKPYCFKNHGKDNPYGSENGDTGADDKKRLDNQLDGVSRPQFWSDFPSHHKQSRNTERQGQNSQRRITCSLQAFVMLGGSLHGRIDLPGNNVPVDHIFDIVDHQVKPTLRELLNLGR